MELYNSGVICTKNRLWKKKKLVIEIVDYFEQQGFSFVEMVYGEPNDFVFTEQKDKIIKTLERKGSFFGIRIKFSYGNTIISIDSNTDGIDNVRYTIYDESQTSLDKNIEIILGVSDLIKPSNEALAKTSEYLSQRPKVVKWIIGILVVIILYLLGAHVLLMNLISIIFSIAPLFIIFLVLSYFLRRR